MHIPHRASFAFNSDNDDEIEEDDKIWKQKHRKAEKVKDHKPAHKEKQGGETRKMKEKMNGEPMAQEEDMVMKEMEDDKTQASVWYVTRVMARGGTTEASFVGPKGEPEKINTQTTTSSSRE
ncbi:hypothetical protein E2562_024990 [Oryza meyeriana var. granulata]|uniref:Uncharacterized protein n=1 Tax=Oryza meyeriana var. granulata TaxID=110450 RepID=A0A6G1FBZ1_9ORYZ|nr:hypothetical protein E2562_024990 [Oryza meyeriana var. granulata]